MIDRVDQLDQYYTPIERCEKWIGYLFLACAFLSIGVPYSGWIPILWTQQALNVLFVVAVVAHFLLLQFSGFYLMPYAEDKRRKQLLSYVFNVPLTPEVTQSYYNNQLNPSIIRLGACILENAFFGKTICHEMAKRERLKILVYILLWVAAISCRNTDPNIVLILTQLLFSSNVLIHIIKIEVLRVRLETIYNNLYAYFFNRTSPTSNSEIASILDSFASYESAKSAACILQSSKIFHKLNVRLSEQWRGICAKLQIDNNSIQ